VELEKKREKEKGKEERRKQRKQNKYSQFDRPSPVVYMYRLILPSVALLFVAGSISTSRRSTCRR
jgi:hypothetical protein